MSKKNERNYGFSGLASLADAPPPRSSPKKVQAPNQQRSGPATGRTSTSQHDTNLGNTHQTASTPSSRAGGSAGWWVMATLLAIIIGYALWDQQDNNPRLADEANQSSSISAYDNSRAGQSSPNLKRRNREKLKFDRPPIGSDIILGASQIRWCLREQIRIHTLASWGAAYIGAHNRRVADYNPRCGEYRYRVGDLSRGRSDVSKLRSQIVSGLRSMYLKSTAEPMMSPTHDTIQSRESVRDIQSLLNQHGFAAGNEDGLMGRKTAAAIRNYQKRANLDVTGKPSKELVDSLRSYLSLYPLHTSD